MTISCAPVAAVEINSGVYVAVANVETISGGFVPMDCVQPRSKPIKTEMVIITVRRGKSFRIGNNLTRSERSTQREFSPAGWRGLMRARLVIRCRGGPGGFY